ncbi:acyl-CoA N-acyltransferase [Penicillium verhagenii]|nr:acyl-CoA N-acyltransferase [Penicillium verhagenii]
MSEGDFYYEQKRLKNDLIALEPSIHVTRFAEEVKNRPEITKYVAFPEINKESDLRAVYDGIRASPADCLYAIIDKSSIVGEYAGTIALTSTDVTYATTEIGIMIFSKFQRSHVATNAIGLLLQYTLDPPSAGGLGLRRVEWKCHSENAASRKAALRMGFEFEGIARWHRTFAIGSPVEALEKRNGTQGELPGRHTASYSIVWEEWDAKRSTVVAQMERKH